MAGGGQCKWVVQGQTFADRFSFQNFGKGLLGEKSIILGHTVANLILYITWLDSHFLYVHMKFCTYKNVFPLFSTISCALFSRVGS